MQLAPRQRGLEHIARVHGAFGLARTHHGVQLVNKNNGLAFVLGQVFEHVFQTLFKLPAKLGARQQRGHVQRQHALALERIGHLTSHDALGQALDNRSLAHAGFADQHGVVLGTALQHLNGAADFVIAANHRVELAHAGALGQVYAVFFEGFTLLFGVGAVHVLAAAHGGYGGLQAFAGQALGARRVAQIGFAIGQGQQKQLASNKLVAALDGLFFRRLQQRDQITPYLHLILAVDFGQLLQRGLGDTQKPRVVHTRALQQGFGAIALVQHGRHHMGGLNKSMVLPEREGLGLGQGLLEFGRQFVNTHGDLRFTTT